MKELKPSLLHFADGTAVTRADWPRRREELAEAIIGPEYGGMPPRPEGTEIIQFAKSVMRDGTETKFNTYEVRTILAGGEISFLLSLWIPRGDGPFPVILDGDGCWRYFNDEVVKRVVARGYIAASFNRTAIAADNAERFRETGIYRIIPSAEFGALSAWAWGYHRCVDALERLDFARSDQIAITGHSRGGKTVLLAGVTDERIALTNPNDSGIGGSGLNRLKCAGSEKIGDFFGGAKNIFWFGSEFRSYRDRDAELPFDQHFLHALIAPRALLVTDAYGDLAANPPGSYAACVAAREAYELLGAREAIGWALREGGHDHAPLDYEALLDFADKRFCGAEVVRGFHRQAYCDLDSEFV